MDRLSGPSHRTAARIFDLPNLDEARERALLIRARSNDPADDSRAALNELWMSHGKLVAAIAAKCRRSDIEHDDLINAGHLGLHTAIMRFDVERFDTRLSAYAPSWIRWHIQDYIRRNAGPVRLPESKAHRQLAQSAPRLIAEARKACERDGVDPSDSEVHERIAHRLGLTADEVARGLRLLQGARMSLHADDDEDGFETSLRDEAALTADDMNERMDHDRLRTRIRVLVNEVLGERERAVFLARSMAISDQVPSLDTFAGLWGVSTARVHQIEVSARRKIATALASSGYFEVTGDHVVAHLSQIRARRDTGARGLAARQTPFPPNLPAWEEPFALRAVAD